MFILYGVHPKEMLELLEKSTFTVKVTKRSITDLSKIILKHLTQPDVNIQKLISFIDTGQKQNNLMSRLGVEIKKRLTENKQIGFGMIPELVTSFGVNREYLTHIFGQMIQYSNLIKL